MLRHLNFIHGLSCPLARLSSRLTEVRWGALFVLLSHSLHLRTLGWKLAGFTECKKPFLDFKRLSSGIFPCKEWASFVSCLAFSTLAHTSRLMTGGATPDNKCNSSTLVGLRHPVIARHALLSSESSLYACADLAVEGLVVSVDVKKDGGQDTSLWQAVLLFLSICFAHCSVPHRTSYWTACSGLLYIVGCLELCCRVSVLGFYDSLCRMQQIGRRSCTGDHASLVAVFNVLGQVQQLAAA